MTPIDPLIDRYIEAWNENDPVRRRELVARTWTETATYLDPALEAQGQPAIESMIEAVQARFPGARFRRTGGVDIHHDHVRFPWALGPEDGPPIVAGVDFAQIAPDARLASVTGFFDAAPATQA